MVYVHVRTTTTTTTTSTSTRPTLIIPSRRRRPLRRSLVFFCCATTFLTLWYGNGVDAFDAYADSKSKNDPSDGYSHGRADVYVQPYNNHNNNRHDNYNNRHDNYNNNNDDDDNRHRHQYDLHYRDNDYSNVETESEPRSDDYGHELELEPELEEEEAAAMRNLVDEHESPPVKVKLNGDLATPAPQSGIELGFVPKQTYYQVRRYDTQLHLPRSAAADQAETAEELANAPRLREVISHKKTQEVYEEQGYEDAAYDHGGYKKAGQRHEKIHSPIVVAPVHDDYTVAAASAAAHARIDHQSAEPAHIVNSARLDNGSMAAVGNGGHHDNDNDSNNGNNDDDDDQDDNGVRTRNRKTKQRNAPHAGEANIALRGDDVATTSSAQRKKTKTHTGLRSRPKVKEQNDDASWERAVAESNASYSSKAQRKRPSSSSSPSPQQPSLSSTTAQQSHKKRRKMKNNATTPTTTTSKKRTKTRLTNDNDDDDDGDGDGDGHEDNAHTVAATEVKKKTDTKLGQESKTVQSKLKVTRDKVEEPTTLTDEQPYRQRDTLENDDSPTPTTYRPSTLPYAFTKLRTATTAAKRKPSTTSATNGGAASFAKSTLVDSSGYVFENPFVKVENSNETNVSPEATSFHIRPTLKSVTGGAVYAVDERPSEHDARTRSSNANAKLASVAKLKYASANKLSKFPYRIVKPNDQDQDHDKAKRTKEQRFGAKATDFPYEIVTANATPDGTSAPSEKSVWSSQAPAPAPHKQRFKFPRLKNEAASSLGTVDDSPWIPIAPNEAYDIHGYAARLKKTVKGAVDGGVHLEPLPAALQIRVTESAENSAERRDAVPAKKRKTNAIRVWENSNAPFSFEETRLPATTGTSRTVSTAYSIRHEYDRPTAPPEAAYFEAAISKLGWPPDRRVHRFEGGRTTPSLTRFTSQPFDSTRQTLPSFRRGHADDADDHDDDVIGSQTQSQSRSRSPSPSRFSMPARSASSSPKAAAAAAAAAAANDTLETLSSNRYAIFQRYEYTTSPMQQLGTDAEDDDAASQPSSPPPTSFQYRHPYLSRETSLLQQPRLPAWAAAAAAAAAAANVTANSRDANASDAADIDRFANTTSVTRLGSSASATTTTTTTTIATTATTPTTTTPTTKSSESATVQPPKRLDKIIVYPVDYASSASFVQNLTWAHYADPLNTLPVRASVPLNYRDRFSTLADHLTKNKSGAAAASSSSAAGSPRRTVRSAPAAAAAAAAGAGPELLNVYMDGSTTELTVDVDKYPFYKSVSSVDGGAGANSLSKYSVLRYISNPNSVPIKAAGQMSFYQSTNAVRCPDPEPPRNVVPKRQQDGEWMGEPDNGRGKPRVRNVGRSILCHKIKFFGSDPLDNPFFKEELVGFPQVTGAVGAKRGRRSKKKKKKLVAHAADDSDGEGEGEGNGNGHGDGDNGGGRPAPAARRKAKAKRAAKIASPSDADHRTAVVDGKKTVRKAYLAGGFINTRDNDSDSDSDSHSHRVDTQLATLHENTPADTDALVAITDAAPTTTTTTTPTMTTFPRFKGDAYGWRTTTTTTSTSTTTTTTPLSISSVTLLLSSQNGTKSKDRITATSARPKLGEDDDVAANNHQHPSSFKPQYKEPSWRNKEKYRRPNEATASAGTVVDKRALSVSADQGGPADAFSSGSAQVDSLLYVIHPHSGRGKWMKILKVEQLPTRSSATSPSTAAPAPAPAPTTLADARPTANDDHQRHRFASSSSASKPSSTSNSNYSCGFGFGGFGFEQLRQSHQSMETRPQRDRKQIAPNYNRDRQHVVYHISGLLKQVAPLKASQAEINNLQTAEEHLEEDVDDVNASTTIGIGIGTGTGTGTGIDANNNADVSSTTVNARPNSNPSSSPATQFRQHGQRDHVLFPQPHERLYYYVVDE